MSKFPKISVIIPTLNEEAHIKLLLPALKGAQSEIIVVDGGSEDETLKITESFGDVVCLVAEKGRALQMNAGAALAKGEILLFLHADTLLPRDFEKLILEAMNDPSVIAGSFHLKFDREHWLLRFYSRCSRFNHRVATYGDQAIFIRSSIFHELGGYRNIPIMEDLEIQQRLRRLGKFKKLDSAVITSARKFSEKGILWNEVRNIFLVMLYFLGVSPEKLARYY